MLLIAAFVLCVENCPQAVELKAIIFIIEYYVWINSVMSKACWTLNPSKLWLKSLSKQIVQRNTEISIKSDVYRKIAPNCYKMNNYFNILEVFFFSPYSLLSLLIDRKIMAS